MSMADFLVLWGVSWAAILAYRVLPAMLLRGRELPARVSEALALIPPAAFAALVANDLFAPGMLDAGLWPAALPLVVSAAVVAVCLKTRSMLWCCVAGVACYVLLALATGAPL